MRHTSFKYVAMLALLMVFATSCSDKYLDINTNPNQATAVPPELVLPTALNATGTYFSTNFPFLNLWMGYWNWSGNYSISQSDKNYRFTTSYQTDIWNDAYTRLKDYDYVEKQAVASNQPYLQAVAKIMKGLHFQILVDTYGNVPYTDALQGLNNLQPKYEDGKVIYESVMNEWTAALALIARGQARVRAGETSLNLGTNDIMFKGDMAKWARFTNTLKLRMLLRQSERSDRSSYIQAEIAKIKASNLGFLKAGENASVNPGYTNSDNRQNPFYGTFGFGVNGSAVELNNQYRGNKYALDYYAVTTGDYRVLSFYDPAATGGNFTGTFFGDVNVLVNSRTSAIGSGASGLTGILKGPDQDAVILASHESLLLQAEATQRGWLVGSALTLYESAVVESYTNLDVQDAAGTPEDYALDYLSNAVRNVAWASSPNKIEAIVTQHWAANNALSPFESWANYRRLGFPAVPISRDPSVTVRQIPVRLLYPQSEYNFNAANVTAQGTISQFTTKPFWMK
jgi:Starch-binding associating with outer membrane